MAADALIEILYPRWKSETAPKAKKSLDLFLQELTNHLDQDESAMDAFLKDKSFLLGNDFKNLEACKLEERPLRQIQLAHAINISQRTCLKRD